MHVRYQKTKSLLTTFIVLILILASSLSWFNRFTFELANYETTENRFFTIVTKVIYENKNNEVLNFTKGDRVLSLFVNNSWQTVSLIAKLAPFHGRHPVLPGQERIAKTLPLIEPKQHNGSQCAQDVP